MKKHIPNALTCCNLISGCVATYFALRGEFEWAFLSIVVGAVFDFFDGFVARLLHVSSSIGKELDSLADDVTFGVAPASIVYSLLSLCVVHVASCDCLVWKIMPFAAFLIAAFSALRLAKFNLDERQTTSFIGLPTPANALFWASTSVLVKHACAENATYVLIVLLAGILLSCWLLVAEIPMFALKFKSYAWSANKLRYTFAAVSLLILLLIGAGAFAVIIPLYIVCSLVSNAVSR